MSNQSIQLASAVCHTGIICFKAYTLIASSSSGQINIQKVIGISKQTVRDEDLIKEFASSYFNEDILYFSI